VLGDINALYPRANDYAGAYYSRKFPPTPARLSRCRRRIQGDYYFIKLLIRRHQNMARRGPACGVPSPANSGEATAILAGT